MVGSSPLASHIEALSRLLRDPPPPSELEEKLRARLRMLESRGVSWHIHSSTSMAPILAALYGSWIPSGLRRGVKRIALISKGHGSLAVYALLEILGVVEPGSVERMFSTPGSPMPAHPEARRTPLTLVSTGSLGQVLSVGLGILQASRISKESVEVAVVLGDGELDEGQVWEAVMSAAAEGARGLIAVVDRNMRQHTGPTEEVKPKEPLAEKWRAFGWDVWEVEGRAEIVAEALEEASRSPRPSVVIVRGL
ncbi:MAG: hypothetical protein F7B17_00545 [Desulfurococcales archaeon]|nr:hypothetical protein [Desulfurococcales archaeon]